MRLLDDVAEVRTPPGPVVVDDDVGGAGIERSVVSVELARLVRRMTLPCKVDLAAVQDIRLPSDPVPVPSAGQVYSATQLTVEMSTA